MMIVGGRICARIYLKKSFSGKVMQEKAPVGFFNYLRILLYWDIDRDRGL